MGSLFADAPSYTDASDEEDRQRQGGVMAPVAPPQEPPPLPPPPVTPGQYFESPGDMVGNALSNSPTWRDYNEELAPDYGPLHTGAAAVPNFIPSAPFGAYAPAPEPAHPGLAPAVPN